MYKSRRGVLTSTGFLTVALAGCTVENGGNGGDNRDNSDGDPIERIDELSGSDDPAGIIFEAELDGARVGELSTYELDEEAYSESDLEPPEPRDAVFETINPTLKRRIDHRPEARELVVINFADEFEMPRFPDPVLGEPHDSEANREIKRRTERLIEAIKEHRAPEFTRIIRELQGEYRIEVQHQFWLVKAVVAVVTLGDVPEIAARDDVLYVEPDNSDVVGAGTTQELIRGSTETDQLQSIQDGRDLITSEPYYAVGLDDISVGLIDTGVNENHDLLSDPSPLRLVKDCVDMYCYDAELDDPWDHGTGMAAIISGNGNMGPEYRGITEMTLDSFGTSYWDTNEEGEEVILVSTEARIKAFEESVLWFNRVIANAVGNNSSPWSSGSMAADNAYHCGVSVITSNGNEGPDGETIGSPANAANAMGIGAYSIGDGTQYDNQSRGPTTDGRTKPDVQAPTNAMTASSASSDALDTLCCTSGATPFAAGAAALLANWFRWVTNSATSDPGQVNAHLILSGQDPDVDNTTGAGRIELPTGGLAHWGKLQLESTEQVDVPFIVNRDHTVVDAALWWPDSIANGTGQVDSAALQLVDPEGSVRTTDLGFSGAFRRVRVDTDVQHGFWKVRVHRFVLPSEEPSPVYFSALRK